MPLKARQGDRGVGKVDLFAVVDGRLPCVGELKVAGETNYGEPLWALLEGLTYCAIVEANARDIASEVTDQYALSASRPTLVVMALLDARFEMGLCGRPARLVGSCRMASVDERLISRARG